jgi:hypothetical protein
MSLRLISPRLMPALSLAATSSWETKTDPFTLTGLHTSSPALYLALSPVRVRPNTPPYSLVLNTPLVSETFVQTSATRNLQRSSCVTILALSALQQIQLNKNDPKQSTWLRFHWVRDRVRQGQFTISYIKSADNIADYFTKNLDPITH